MDNLPFRNVATPDFQGRENIERHRPHPGYNDDGENLPLVQFTIQRARDGLESIVSNCGVGRSSSNSTESAQKSVNDAKRLAPYDALIKAVVQ